MDRGPADRRAGKIVIRVDPRTRRPSVTLDGAPLDSSHGWQAAVDLGVTQVAARAARLGEPLSVVIVDTDSRWTGRFIARPDRSVVEDLTPPPPPRRRRGPVLLLLAAAAVLIAGSAVVVVGTRPTSAAQPPGSAPVPPPTSTAASPLPYTPPPFTPAPITPAPPAIPTVDPAPITPAPTADAPVRRAPEARPAPRKPAPRPVPAREPAPTHRPAPAARGVPGRVVDGLGACLGARSTSLESGSCLPDRPDQIWTRTAAGHLMTAGGCLTEIAAQALAVRPCRPDDPAQTWRTGSRLIVNAGTGACALVRRPETGRPVAVTVRCDAGGEPRAQFLLD
ncbi:MAG: RICIN domain-containing protein [Pseudonocardia sp.]|nr:RICIN domain-containing protein [Pseudonocardia sp.]